MEKINLWRGRINALPKNQQRILAAVAITCILVFVLIIKVITQPYRVTQSFTQHVTSKPVFQSQVVSGGDTSSISAKDIADSTNSFLNTNRRSDGFYNFDAFQTITCTKDPNTPGCANNKPNMAQVVNLWTMLGRIGYFRVFSQNSADLAQAEADAQALMNYCKTDPGSCYVATASFDELYKETNNTIYKTFMQQIGAGLLQNNASDDPMILGMQARALARLYALTKDKRYADLANKKLPELQAVAKAYTADAGRNDFLCYTVLGQVELGKATNNSALLLQATQSLKNYTNANVVPQLTFIDPCIEAAFILGGTDTQMQTQGETLLKEYVEKSWDGPKLGRVYQNGGFAMGSDRRYVNMTDTAYMLYLLSFAPGQTYTFAQ